MANGDRPIMQLSAETHSNQVHIHLYGSNRIAPHILGTMSVGHQQVYCGCKLVGEDVGSGTASPFSESFCSSVVTSDNNWLAFF